MIDSKNFDGEYTKFQNIHIRIKNLVFELFIILFIKRFPDKSDRQRCRIDRRKIYVFENMSERSDMIQMSMSNQDSSDVFLVFYEIADIRDDIIHSMHFDGSKFQTSIYDKNIVFVFDQSHIDTDFLKSSERNDSNGNFVFFDQCLRILDDRLGYGCSMTKKSFRRHLWF